MPIPEAKDAPGTKADFDEIFATYEAPIYQYCYRLCRGNRAQAEDLAQDTWILVWRNLRQFQGRSSIKTWLHQIALRRWIRIRGTREAAVPLEEVESQMAPVEPQHQQDLRMWLDAAISRLSEVQRQAFILVKAQGLTHREAAEVLGVPQGTVQFRVHEAVHKLRKDLAGYAAFLGALPALQLDETAREWQAASPPPSFAVRVYSSLENSTSRALPQEEAVVPPARGPLQSIRLELSQGTRRWTAGATITGLIAMGGGVLWHRTASQASAPPEVAAVLRSLQSVDTARATGLVEEVTGGNGTPRAVTRRALKAWFKLPGKYRQRLSPRPGSGGNRMELIRDGGRGVVLLTPPRGRTIVVAADAQDATSELAGFGLFTPDGTFARAAREPSARVSSVQGEAGNGTVRLVELSTSSGGQPEKWTLFVDPLTHRPIRLEYQREAWQREGRVLTRRVVLESIEYNIAVPDSVFQMPPVKR